MRKIIIAMLLLGSMGAQSAVLCQSMRDPNFQAWFEGYSCPPGYFMIRTK